MKRIITQGSTTYTTHCGQCGCHFSYELSDVSHNYVRGGDHVYCPQCSHQVPHFGTSGSRWPSPLRGYSMSCGGRS